MEKQSKIFVLAGYVYVILPILIFIIGYCNLPVALVGSILVLFCSYLLFKNCPQLWIPQNKKDWLFMAVGLLIITVWTFYSGIGAFSFQTYDHNCRNPIFELLVTEKWPVILEGNHILTYYIGFWLPSAVIGKIFNSINVGYFAQFVWAVLGIFLTFYYVAAIFKKKILLPLIIFIFFSGMDIIEGTFADLLRGFSPLESTWFWFSHIEWSFPGYQFSSFTTQLYWVFNQAIPAWVATMLLYHEKNNKSLIFIYACLFLCSTFPALGLFPFVFYWMFKNSKNIKNAIKSGFSLQNVIGAFFITPITYLYLSNNVAGSNISGVAESTNHLSIAFFFIWFFVFIMLEVGWYLIFVLKKYKSDPLYYIIWLGFLIYPFIHIGSSADFCMRATIPLLIILYLYVVSIFYEKNNKLSSCILVIILILGSFTPLHEIVRSICYTAKGITKIESKLGFENFFGYTENNYFFKYIAKK